MWRVTAVQFYALFNLIHATAIPSASSEAVTKTQLHSPARVSEPLRAKHGYRYEVEFPSTQHKDIISTRYQATEKDEDNDSSSSIGSSTLAKYTNGQKTNSTNSLQEATYPDNYSRLSRDNNTNENYFSPISTEKSKIEFDIDNNELKNTSKSFLQQSVYFSPKSDEVLSTRQPNIHLLPETFDSPVTSGSEVYSYDKPSNQLTLPNENINHVYFMFKPDWYPSTPTNNDDDSIEVFPPTESSHTTWSNENTENRNYKLMEETQESADIYFNSLRPKTQDQRTVAFNGYNNYESHNNYNSKVPLPNTNAELDSSFNNPIRLPYRYESDKDVRVATQINPLENLKSDNYVKVDQLKSAQVYSSNLETEVDDLSKTSLMVHFAGSVFSAEGLPHTSKEMVFPVDYNFSYDLRGWPKMGHEEMRMATTTKGRYWVGLPDGRIQVVEYTAGPQGFMPIVTYKSREL